jgi:hypothetical protein
VVIYGGSLILTNVMINILWLYATGRHRLVDADINPHFVHMVTRRNLIGPSVYLISIGVSFLPLVGTIASLILFVLVPVYYVLPTRIDLHLTPTSQAEGESEENERSAEQQVTLLKDK